MKGKPLYDAAFELLVVVVILLFVIYIAHEVFK